MKFLKWFISVCVFEMCLAQMPESLFVGTVYNIFQEEFTTDREFFSQVDSDIALMQECNITHVMIFPMSQWDPDTKQLLWKRTDYLIKKIEDAHMKFIPLMLKEEQCSHYFPIWKFKEIKGMWEEYNLKNGNKNNREDVDFADPRVYPLVEEYFRAVIERYGKSPALSFYNIWNEPHYTSNADHVIERFRQWLQKKYGSLSSLRRAWGKEYSDWNQVSPFLNDNWNSSMPQIDWILFRSELNGMLLKQLTTTLRRYDTIHPVNCNPIGTSWANFGNFGSYNTDNWSLAESDDIPGISYYPDFWEREHSLEPCPFWLHNFTFNTIRCASSGNQSTREKKNYILTELFTNAQNGLALNGYLSPEFVANLAWTAMANDCKGLVYWKWQPFMRGRQSLGRGLCQVDGELAERGKAVQSLGAVLKKYGHELFRAHPKNAQVAILVDMVGLLKTLEQTAEPSTTKFMYESTAGLFKVLYENNIAVDMIRMDRSIEWEKLRSYKILFLPFQIVIRRDIAKKLKDYVQQGGWVVADARTATLDEFDFAYRVSPGAGLDELFGATRTDWIGQKTYYKVQMNNVSGDSTLFFQGKYFRDQLHVTGKAEVLGTFVDNGDPALIQNDYGKGKAILSAVPLGASCYGMTKNPVSQVLIQCVNQSGFIPDVGFYSSDTSFINYKLHTLNDTLILYVFNSDLRPTTGTIEVNVGDHTVKQIKNIVLDQNVIFRRIGQRVWIPVELQRNQIMVLFIESQ